MVEIVMPSYFSALVRLLSRLQVPKQQSQPALFALPPLMICSFFKVANSLAWSGKRVRHAQGHWTNTGVINQTVSEVHRSDHSIQQGVLKPLRFTRESCTCIWAQRMHGGVQISTALPFYTPVIRVQTLRVAEL